MNSDPARDYLQLPKAELHRHLEGSLRPESVFNWLDSINYPLPVANPRNFKPICQVLQPMQSLHDVLARFEWVQRAFVSYEAVNQLTWEVCEDAAAEKIVLLELRFSPDFMTQPHNLHWDRTMEQILAAVEGAEQRWDMAIGLVVIATRELGLDSLQRTIDFALRWRESIVGFDLAGSEEGIPLRELRKAMEPLHIAGLGITIHSGESTTASHVLRSVEELGAHRIGHGIRIVDDKLIMEQIAERKIAFEVCPTSNIRIGAVHTYENHPIMEMHRNGLTVTINSDDPGLFDYTLTHEFEQLASRSLFSRQELALINQQAFQCSFIAESKKHRVSGDAPATTGTGMSQRS